MPYGFGVLGALTAGIAAFVATRDIRTVILSVMGGAAAMWCVGAALALAMAGMFLHEAGPVGNPPNSEQKS
jgi:hypothetical protein